MRTWSALITASVIPVMACSLFTSLDGLSDGSSSDGGDTTIGSDGATFSSDAAKPTDGSIGTDDSGAPNLVTNPSFEEGTGGCGTGWGGGQTYNATYQRSSVARTGSSSCEVCPVGSGNVSFALAPNTAFEAVAGSYYAEAWLHAPPDAGSTGATGIQVILDFADGGEVVYQGTQVAPNDGWQVTSYGFTTDSEGQMTLQIHTYEGGGCLLIDDVAIYAQ